MISPCAEHCFWMSRYLERAENTARVLEVNQTLLLDFEVPRRAAVEAAAHHQRHPRHARRARRRDGAALLTWETENPSSIASSLAAARENARIIREVISADMWERINYYYLWMQSGRRRAAVRQQPQRVLQPDQAHQPAHPRHQRRHDVARRGLGVLSAGQISRTGLPDGAHPRREVPHPAADAASTSARRWTTPTGWRSSKSCSGYEPYHKQRARRRRPGRVGGGLPDFRPAVSALGAPLPARMPAGGPRDLRPAAGAAAATRSSSARPT